MRLVLILTALAATVCLSAYGNGNYAGNFWGNFYGTSHFTNSLGPVNGTNIVDGTINSNKLDAATLTWLQSLGGGGSQTPWTGDVDAAGDSLTNALNIQFTGALIGDNFNGLTTGNPVIHSDAGGTTVYDQNGQPVLISDGTSGDVQLTETRSGNAAVHANFDGTAGYWDAADPVTGTSFIHMHNDGSASSIELIDPKSGGDMFQSYYDGTAASYLIFQNPYNNLSVLYSDATAGTSIADETGTSIISLSGGHFQLNGITGYTGTILTGDGVANVVDGVITPP